MRNIEPDSDENIRASRDNEIATKVAQHEHAMHQFEKDASVNYPLFKHLIDEHGLTLLESELHEIRLICQRMDREDLRAALFALLSDMLRQKEERFSGFFDDDSYQEYEDTANDVASLLRVIALVKAEPTPKP